MALYTDLSVSVQLYTYRFTKGGNQGKMGSETKKLNFTKDSNHEETVNRSFSRVSS